jgi:hypothetical protein
MTLPSSFSSSSLSLKVGVRYASSNDSSSRADPPVVPEEDIKEAMAQFGRRKWGSVTPKRFRDPSLSPIINRDNNNTNTNNNIDSSDTETLKSTPLDVSNMQIVRQTTIPVRANRMADLKRFYDEVLQPIFSVPGFKGAYLLINNSKVNSQPKRPHS